MPFADMREWLDAMLKIGEVRMFEGVDPELEMGAMTELSAEAKGPALLFDNILGYPKGHRVMSNPFCGNRRLLATLDMPMDLTASEALMSWRLFIREFKPVPPVWVDTGPVFDHRMTGDEVDLSPFPAPRWHELDAGRYIGTGVVVVLRDPDSGWVNLGTYRLMNHDRQTVGFFIQNIRGGYRIAKKYWDQGRACPVAVSLGHDPLLLLVAGDSAARTPMGVSEYDFAGYLRGKPVEIVPGPFTGLPIPATSEVVLEGEIPSPEEEQRKEGPFGEFLGYYAHGMLEEPVIRIKSICYRNDPILFGAPALEAHLWIEDVDPVDLRGTLEPLGERWSDKHY